jgi:pseudouridine synthase
MEERLQKIIARAGIASRRKAEELISAGQVTINGKVVTQLGTRANPEKDHIKVRGKLILPEPLQYFAFHKPAGVLSAASDSGDRPVVTDYVRAGCRLYPAGRLDYNSEGLLILTNDGGLTKFITTAGKVAKVYRVKVLGRPGSDQLDLLRRGLTLSDGTGLAPCRIRHLKSGPNSWYEVRLKQGRNRQIRRMFEHIGHGVMRLRRVAIGPVRLGNLPAGKYRKLTRREIASLLQVSRAHRAGRSARRKRE